MHGHPKHTTAPMTATLGGATGAVTWIDSRRAIVARSGNGEGPVVSVIAPEPIAGPYLARVVDAIGDRDRVLILGPDAMRVELEREYVSIFHRPDRLLDVEAADVADEAELVRRLTVLTAG